MVALVAFPFKEANCVVAQSNADLGERVKKDHGLLFNNLPPPPLLLSPSRYDTSTTIIIIIIIIGGDDGDEASSKLATCFGLGWSRL